MIEQEVFPLRNFSLRLLIFFCGLICAYWIFIGLTSIWVGVSASQRDGSWVPITTGAILIIALLYLFIRFTRNILKKLKEKENSS